MQSLNDGEFSGIDWFEYKYSFPQNTIKKNE